VRWTDRIDALVSAIRSS